MKTSIQNNITSTTNNTVVISNNEQRCENKKQKKKKKKKKESYKSIMKQILTSKSNAQEKDKQKILNATGGAKFVKVSKI